MSKTTPIPGFVPAAPLSSPAGVPEQATSPARGPSSSPGAGAAPVAARSSSLTSGTAGRVSLPGMSAPQTTSFARVQQNAAGPQTPRDVGIAADKEWLKMDNPNSGGDSPAVPKPNLVSVTMLAALMHQFSNSQSQM